MTYVNQQGQPVIERTIWVQDASPQEVAKVLSRLLDYLQLEAVETNATKHGYVEIELRSTASEDTSCPTCGEDGGTSCGLPNCGLLQGDKT